MTTPGTPHTPAQRPEPAGTGPVAGGPPSAGDLLEGFPTTGGTVELFPVNFTAYRHNPDLETDEHVRKIADLLAPYGLHVNRWTTPGDQRDRQAVEDRLGTWKRPDGGYGNTVLYWVGHGSAESLAHHRTPAPIDDGITPHEVARAIGSRQLHPDAEDSWAIVVLDACFSHDFAQTVHSELINKYGRAERYLLLSTAAKGHAELGTFTHALERALTVTFRGQPAIGLAALGSELEEELGGYRGDRASNRRDRLVRLTPDVAASVTAPWTNSPNSKPSSTSSPPTSSATSSPRHPAPNSANSPGTSTAAPSNATRSCTGSPPPPAAPWWSQAPPAPANRPSSATSCSTPTPDCATS